MTSLACPLETKGWTRAGARALGRQGPRHLAAFLLVAGATALAACEFRPGSLDPGDGSVPPDADPLAPDAAEPPIDADPDAPDAVPCAWSYEPEHVNPCELGKPDPQSDLNLGSGGPYVYNTTDGGFEGAAPPDTLTVTDEGGVHTIWVRNFTLGDGVSLRVRGNHPLMIVASEKITVNGTIDASSSWNPDTDSFDRGPGLEPPECSSAAPEVGGPCTHGGGGGGGGGFRGAGGPGGAGGGLRSGCPGDTFGAPGGASGDAVPVPDKIRAGCDGARGGNGEEDNLYGDGGAGGGAVHLVARLRLEVAGTIHAGGAGGAGAVDKRNGGGGGGSGGFIGLEAPDIAIGTDAVIAANGGGGGGGTERRDEATSGTNGLASGDFAAGGTGFMGGNGGAGSDIDTLDGTTGGDGNRGGGGGGGGAGFIIFYQDTPTLTGSPVISPPPTQR